MGRVIDMTGAGTMTPAPTGDYTLELSKYEWVAIKSGANAGKEMAKAQYVIVDEAAEDGTPVAGKVIFRNYPLLTTTRWVFLNDMIALGYPEDEIAEGEVDWDVVLAANVGRRALGHVTTSTFVYPEGHAKFGQTRSSNDLDGLEALEMPEVLTSSRRRRE